MSISVAVVGYGNLGRGVELAVKQNDDMKLFGVFSRRDPDSVKTVTGVSVYKLDDILNYKDMIDVVIICGGSATDLPVQTPMLASNFNVIDSFDTHAKIPEHFESVDNAATQTSIPCSFRSRAVSKAVFTVLPQAIIIFLPGFPIILYLPGSKLPGRSTEIFPRG